MAESSKRASTHPGMSNNGGGDKSSALSIVRQVRKEEVAVRRRVPHREAARYVHLLSCEICKTPTLSTSRPRGESKDAPNSLIFRPISVNAWIKFSVSRDATCAPSFRSMFNPSVQSAQRAWSVAIWSARDDPLAVRSENDSGDAASGDVGIIVMSTLGSCWPWYGTHVPVATSLTIERSIRSGRSSNPLRTPYRVALST